MYVRAKELLSSIRWTPRTVVAVVVLVLVPGGVLIAPWLIGSRGERSTKASIGDQHNG